VEAGGRDRSSRGGIRAWLALPAPHESFPCLDGMRALAALGVFLFHAGRQTSFFFTDSRLTLDHLDVGVAVFFVLSGFLIYRPFAAANLSGSRTPGLRGYFRRRAFRIYPAYVVALVVLWRLGDVDVDGRVGLLKHLTLLSGYFRDPGGAGLVVAWTLTVEVSFYAFAPLWSALVRRVGRRTGLRTGRWNGPLGAEVAGALALTALGFGSIWWFYPSTSVWPGLRVLPPALSSLGVGMLFAVLSAQADRAPAWAGALRRVGNPVWAWWALATAAFVAMRSLCPAPMNFLPVFTPEKVPARAWQVAVAFALMLPMVFGDQRAGLVRRILRSRPAVFAGTVSYAFYLWHYSVIHWVVDRPATMFLPYHRGRELAQVAVALVVSLLIATASWYLVERPALRFGRRSMRSTRATRAEVRVDTTGEAARQATGEPANVPGPPSPV